MRRFKLATTLAVGVAIGVLVAATGAAGTPPPQPHGKNVRWDIVTIVGTPAPPTVIAGASGRSRDAATQDTIELSDATGSVRLHGRHRGDAVGGGRFVHRHDDGTVVAQGVFLVTGFRNWDQARGSLPIRDGIGDVEDASAGILTLDVRLYPEGGGQLDGVLSINCHLPDTPDPIVEGFTLDVGPFHFVQDGANAGGTLFHVTK